jgi:hypothetical protein
MVRALGQDRLGLISTISSSWPGSIAKPLSGEGNAPQYTHNIHQNWLSTLDQLETDSPSNRPAI